MFVKKLQEKGQTSEQQNQAAHALSLFFESQPKSTLPHCHATPIPTLTLPLKGRKITSSSPLKEVIFPVRDGAKERDCSSEAKEEGTVQRSGRRFNEWRCLEKSGSPDWDKENGDRSKIIIKRITYVTLDTREEHSTPPITSDTSLIPSLINIKKQSSTISKRKGDNSKRAVRFLNKD